MMASNKKFFRQYEIIMKILGKILLFFCFLLMPTVAYADAGIKLTSNSLLQMLIILLLIIFIEALIYALILKVKIRNTLLPSLISNLVSTVAGIPLLMLVGAYFLLHLYHYLDKLFPAYRTRIYNPDTFDLIAAFFITVIIEYFVVKPFFKSASISKIRTAVLVGNIITYSILFLMLITRVTS
jgi:hypothetical protein